MISNLLALLISPTKHAVLTRRVSVSLDPGLLGLLHPHHQDTDVSTKRDQEQSRMATVSVPTTEVSVCFTSHITLYVRLVCRSMVQWKSWQYMLRLKLLNCTTKVTLLTYSLRSLLHAYQSMWTHRSCLITHWLSANSSLTRSHRPVWNQWSCAAGRTSTSMRSVTICLYLSSSPIRRPIVLTYTGVLQFNASSATESTCAGAPGEVKSPSSVR